MSVQNWVGTRAILYYYWITPSIKISSSFFTSLLDERNIRTKSCGALHVVADDIVVADNIALVDGTKEEIIFKIEMQIFRI